MKMALLTFALATLLSLASSSPLLSATKRQPQPYLQVTTETDLTWCRPYADEMGAVVTYFYSPTAINVTCWGETTMKDAKGEVLGDPLWLYVDPVGKGGEGGEGLGCWINEEYIQASNIDFTTSLSACPSVPAHQVGFPKDAYTTSEGIPCYASTTNGNATASQYVSVGYTGLGCSVQGAVVNGNATWVKWLDGSCYFPGDTWDQAEFHGYAVGEC